MSSEMTGSTAYYDDNPNIYWASLFVDELARGGLDAVCIAPGSRSTPLTLAFYANKHFKVYQHLDERSAAFFALGMALKLRKPVALVCTSGTAAANFYPALIEAYMSEVPLLILTADRPPELRHSGANQTIDQVKMFGDHVLWSVDVALPQENAPHQMLRSLNTLAARAIARSNGLVKGPVHLNFPFRKPLEPHDPAHWPVLAGDNNSPLPYTAIAHGRIHPTGDQLEFLIELVKQQPHGLIICGPACPAGDFPAAVTSLASAAGYPIFADPLSGIRFGPYLNNAAILGGYESFLQFTQLPWPKPQLILRFGAVPTSKWLNEYLDNLDPLYHIHIRESGKWADQSHKISHFLQINPAITCEHLVSAIQRRTDRNWQKGWTGSDEHSWIVINEMMAKSSFDGAVVAALLHRLPPQTKLFVGNSLAIRHVDQFGRPLAIPLQLFANRGASGIDGNISTGLGIAAASSGLTVLLVGDLTFYHDNNGLLALQKLIQGQVIIVLLNNNGGGIFRRLPVSQIEPPFEALFLTPHDLDFSHLAAMYGLLHFRAADLNSFKAALESTLAGNSSSIIEVQSDSEKDEQVRQEIISAVKSQVGSLLASKVVD